MGATSQRDIAADVMLDRAEAHIQIARITVTIRLDRTWNSFELATSAPPLCVTDSAMAPSARMPVNCEAIIHAYAQMMIFQ